jgi:hypothetical protein
VYYSVDWIQLAQDRVSWRALENTVTGFRKTGLDQLRGNFVQKKHFAQRTHHSCAAHRQRLLKTKLKKGFSNYVIMERNRHTT